MWLHTSCQHNFYDWSITYGNDENVLNGQLEFEK